MNKIKHSTLDKFLRNNRWAWTPSAIAIIIISPLTVPYVLIKLNWCYIKLVYLDTFKLMIHQVDLDE
jgi:hypothetical protein